RSAWAARCRPAPTRTSGSARSRRSAAPTTSAVPPSRPCWTGQLIRLNPNPQLGAKIAVLYTAWMLVGFNRVHPIAGMPGRIIKQPYARTVEGLFDGRHTGDQVIGGLPATINGLLTPYGVNLLRHPTGGFAAALRS